MKFKTIGQTIDIQDSYIKEHPDKCAKLKRELVKIGSDYDNGKVQTVDKLSNHPIITKPFEYVPKRSRLGYGYSHRNAPEYHLVFNDCLAGVDWVKAHYQDVMPEPTIELTVNGRTRKLNGDYKPGVIKALIKA